MLREGRRKINLTSTHRKILEQIVKVQVCTHFDRNEMFSRSQHEFVRNKTCQFKHPKENQVTSLVAGALQTSRAFTLANNSTKFLIK